MAESLNEFFSDDALADSDVGNEAALIHDYLAGNITVYTTVQRLAQSLQTPSNPSQLEYTLADILDSVVVRVAEELSETHDTLVTLLCTLKPQIETSIFKSSLGFALNERWLRYGDPDPSSSHRDELRAIWTNLNNFAALMHKAEVQDL
ncbi:hypothetical protein C0991_005712 [Blastosporella zonata]|nr:hypothetical protein C0991_005712 [Blastosporella zonata]